MASSARMFVAGIGTTLLLVGAGFGGGLMLATSALDTTAQSRGPAEPITAARIVLPSTAQAAEPAPVAVAPVPEVVAEASKPEISAPVQQVEKVDTRKAEAEER